MASTQAWFGAHQFVGSPASPAGLLQVVGIVVDPGDEGAAPRELEGVEARVAADVQGGPPGEILWEVVPDLLPLEGREVSQEVVGDGDEDKDPKDSRTSGKPGP